MPLKKTLIALVPARKNSKGIKNKNLLFFRGERIINRAIKIGLKLKAVEKVILSTDSQKIINITKKFHKKIMVIKRNKKIALDKTPMHPVLIDTVRKYEKDFKKKIDGVIILDPTSPLREKNDIDKCIKKFLFKKVDLLLTVHCSESNPYFSILEKGRKYFKLVKGEKLNIGSRQQAPKVFSINTICWIYSRKAILNSNLRIPKKTFIQEIDLKKTLELNLKMDKKKLSIYDKKK